MIVFSNKNIRKLSPKRISKSVNLFGEQVCLAEFDEPLPEELLTEETLEALGISFWWECTSGYFDVELFDYDMWKGNGLIQGVMQTYNISMEKNIAMAIYMVATNVGEDLIDFFDVHIPCEKTTLEK